MERRTFLATALTAVWGGGVQAQEPKKKRLPNSGPPPGLRANSREWIRQFIYREPKVRQANEDVWVSSALENVFYMPLGDHAVLFDTGFDHQVDAHLDGLEKAGCDLSRIVGILASHSHVDHTAGLKRAKKRLSVPVIAHPHAVKPISKGDLLQTAAVIPEVDGWEFPFPPCEIDETVDHGDVIMIGDERIDVYHIPGHTPDCVGYVCKGHFFTGDEIFAAGLIGWSNQRWFTNYADHAETMKRVIKNPVPAHRFYATHGPDFPYDEKIPKAILENTLALMLNDKDPCNHTPRVKRRPEGTPTRTLRLPLKG